jgi:hypothetical protein
MVANPFGFVVVARIRGNLAKRVGCSCVRAETTLKLLTEKYTDTKDNYKTL